MQGVLPRVLPVLFGGTPLICLVLTGQTIQDNLEQLTKNRPYIDLCELRVDLLNPEEYPFIPSFPEVAGIPVILTCRRLADGGKYVGSEKERLALLEEALEGNFAYIDLETDFKRLSLEQKATMKGAKIIRSLHDFNEIPSDIFHRMAKIAARGEIPKMAVMVNSVANLITLFRAKEELREVGEKIVVGMGDFGFPSRILYKRVGSLLTYCSEEAVAPGQISARAMKELYRGDRVDEKTKIFGVIGNPVLHSFSPIIQNQGFHEIKFNAIYLPFPVDNVRSFFILAEMLKITGFSVTVPHKQQVLPYLGKITREVKQIGSCNTVVRANNLWKGTNTDYYGFIAPLIKEIDSQRVQSALVVGAGGAARAVVWALRNHGCKVTIVNRDLKRAEQLANETMSSWDSLENAPLYKDVDLIVQTTPLGMAPYEGVDPIPSFEFKRGQVVYELIYRPHLTPLLKRAQERGCLLLFGIDMLLRQGKLQFESFSGYHYPKRLEVELTLEED
jgi:3-dehydroquinate dehydratase/shikimate dehydrogenase